MKSRIITTENFWDDVVVSLNGCWSKNTILLDSTHRYRAYRFLDKKIRPQIISWFMVKGKFPEGELWNQCGNYQCLNPEHFLEVKSDYDRYMARIYKNPINDCWEWTGFITPDGYGNIKIGKQAMRTHRFSYQFHIGEIPNGVDVLHKCDNRKCSNPSHLFLGNDLDNSLDREIKGRNPHKLSPSQVKEIRDTYIPNKNTIELCLKYDIGRKHLYSIVNKKSWRWIR